MRFLVIGAGLTGAVISRVLAEAGHTCTIYERDPHVAGNCHTARDPETGILVHQYGPHTLHTDNQGIWDFIERFTQIHPYRHRKQAWAQGKLYPFPINLEAINQFFGVTLTTDTVQDFFDKQALRLDQHPRNFEEAALSSIGPKLYEAFYHGYTTKQWGRPANELPAFIFRRLPVHLSSDSNVFHHKQQGQPIDGYTKMVENMLDHENITLFLNRPFEVDGDQKGYDHTFYSGAIDHFFNCSLGRLAYRTLDFEHEHREGQFQDCGTVNYCDLEVPYTRVFEHKHFWPKNNCTKTIISYEFSRECGADDKPYYPIRLAKDNSLYEDYVTLAKREPNVSFVGRLGTYRYLDMDVAIGEAMQAARGTIAAIEGNAPIPAFFVDTNTPHSKT